MPGLTTVLTLKMGQDRLASFDSNYAGTQLFVNYGGCDQGGCIPPAKVTVMPVTGGTQKTILDSTKYDVTMVRSIDQHQLLLIMHNELSRVAGPDTSDKSHNGLWIMNTDGTDLRRLMTDNNQVISALNYTSQYPWSNVSHDDTMYAVQITDTHTSPPDNEVAFGQLAGGTPTVFDSAFGIQLDTVGWTTM
jgi:hypothetical protein